MKTQQSSLKVTPAAIAKIQEYISRSSTVSLVPALTWGMWENESQEQWHVSFYEKDKTGLGVFLETENISIYLLHHWKAQELDNMTLDYKDGHMLIYKSA